MKNVLSFHVWEFQFKLAINPTLYEITLLLNLEQIAHLLELDELDGGKFILWGKKLLFKSDFLELEINRYAVFFNQNLLPWTVFHERKRI